MRRRINDPVSCWPRPSMAMRRPWARGPISENTRRKAGASPKKVRSHDVMSFRELKTKADAFGAALVADEAKGGCA